MTGGRRIGELGPQQIRDFLPHREPFLFVDKILEIVTGVGADGKPTPVGTTVRGVKKFTADMDFFRGHFPGYPITPGVVVAEACGQIGCFVFYPFMKVPKLVGINEARFRRAIVPGDEIEAQVTLRRGKRSIWIIGGTVTVRGEAAGEMELIANFDLKIDN